MESGRHRGVILYDHLWGESKLNKMVIKERKGGHPLTMCRVANSSRGGGLGYSLGNELHCILRPLPIALVIRGSCFQRPQTGKGKNHCHDRGEGQVMRDAHTFPLEDLHGLNVCSFPCSCNGKIIPKSGCLADVSASI